MSAEWFGIYIAWIAAVIALYQVWDLRRSRKRQESPFFEFGSLQINTPLWKNANGEDIQGFTWPTGGADVPEGYPDGSPILLHAYNKGGEARMAAVESLSDLPCQIGWHDRISGDNDLQITYPYSKSRRDKLEKFRITYETVSGEKGEQIFEHRHGRAVYKRVKVK